MKLKWIFIEIFVNIVEVGMLFYLLCHRFQAKYNSFISTLLFIIGNVFFFSLPIFGYFENFPLAEILFFGGNFIYLLLFRHGKLMDKIFWTLISFAIIVALAFFSTAMVSVISHTDSADIIGVMQSSIERILVLMISKISQVVIFYILAKQKKNLAMKIFLTPVSLLVCFIIPLLSIVLGFYISHLINYSIYIPEELIFTVFFSYLAINIIIFVLYEMLNQEAERNYILISKQKQYELTEQHNTQVIEIYNKMREWRHDYANHLQLIVGMLERNASDNNEAVNYIKDLDSKIERSSLNIVTGNLVIDAIISSKAALALSHNIKFDYNILLSKNICVENTDLCSILSNLLDNAIEANCKLNQNRYINIEMITFKNQLNIKIINATNGKYKLEKGKLITTKNGDLHGIGMGHVSSIVKDYEGIFDINPTPESFTAIVSIPLSCKPES
jgi:hypothetical protein